MQIIWDEHKKEMLKKLVMAGYASAGIADRMTESLGEDITVKKVETARARYRLFHHCLQLDKDIKIYKELTLPDGNYIIACDSHSPYHSEIWLNRLLSIADVFKITEIAWIGDLLDMNFAKKWYSDESSNIDTEIEQAEPIFEALDYFEKIYLVQGNHESRVGRMTDGKIQAKHILDKFGKEIWRQKFMYSEYDKLKIGEEWMLVHPKSYSQVSPAVARRLAEKFHRHIINSHGHLVGSSYDRSGKYMAVDLGGMFDIRKIEYINKNTTTHPVWSNGFGMIRNGKFWHFTDSTDWTFWDAF